MSTRHIALVWLWMGGAGVDLTACASGSSPQPITPQLTNPEPGLPSIEREFVQREYHMNGGECTESAEHVVDLQRRCAVDCWADCYFAGTMYTVGCGVNKNVQLATDLFGRACSFGSMLGCGAEAYLIEDKARALQLLEEPCKRGDQWSCGILGVLLSNRGRAGDMPRAKRLLERACIDADLGFCDGFSQVVRQLQLEADFSRATELLDRACQARNEESCHALASAYEDGSLGVTNYDRAAALSQEACEERSYMPACYSLGHLIALGRGCPQDESQAAVIFYKACVQGDYGPACDSMGEAVEKGWAGPSSPSKAVRFYERGCQLGVEHACLRAQELRHAQ